MDTSDYSFWYVAGMAGSAPEVTQSLEASAGPTHMVATAAIRTFEVNELIIGEMKAVSVEVVSKCRIEELAEPERIQTVAHASEGGNPVIAIELSARSASIEKCELRIAEEFDLLYCALVCGASSASQGELKGRKVLPKPGPVQTQMRQR